MNSNRKNQRGFLANSVIKISIRPIDGLNLSEKRATRDTRNIIN